MELLGCKAEGRVSAKWLQWPNSRGKADHGNWKLGLELELELKLELELGIKLELELELEWGTNWDDQKSH